MKRARSSARKDIDVKVPTGAVSSISKSQPTLKELESDPKEKEINDRLRAQMTRIEQSQHTPKFQLSTNGFASVTDETLSEASRGIKHYVALCEATASGSRDFQSFIASQLCYLTDDGDARTMNAGLAFMRGLEPKDEIEALLISQMFATNLLIMKFAGRVERSEMTMHAELAINTLAKLTNRFTQQMEALNRHRGKGQQKVTVEHVTVNSGGQAIVGHVDQGGGGSNEK